LAGRVRSDPGADVSSPASGNRANLERLRFPNAAGALADGNPRQWRRHGDGRKVGVLDDLRGKFVLLNVWATWCVPCRKEMPTLDRLQEQLGGPDFEVVALSVDKGGAEAVRRFYDQIGIRRLSVRVAADPDDLLAALGVYGVPTTLLVDRQSREIGRLVGPANWDSKEMIDFLRMKIAP
jgi:thiol-disulfide isomerase/thioredoxin